MTKSNSCSKKCPFKFENFSIQNIILCLLVLKTIWNSFSSNTPGIDIEELLGRNHENIIPLFQETLIPQAPVMPATVCQSSLSFNKIIILGFFIFIIFFIRDILENICTSDDEECKSNRCPLLF
jgi:hypothetical protein